MIHRLLALDLVGFEKLDLAFEDGLVVFTGPSGAGKSVLIGSILSLIGLQKPSAKLSEMTFDLPAGLECGDFELDEEVVLKLVNKEKARYYINDQSISKARLKQLFSSHFKHLSVRSGDELSRLQQLLDLQAAADDKGFEQKLQEFENRYMQYKEDEKKLLAINEDENKVQELIEFARFEIDKIESIDPKPGEDEELMQIKHKLSKIDKIKDSIEQASRIFEYESAVFEAYSIMDKDSSLFDEAMNQLRNDFESSQDMVEELSDVDVEYVLDRIEKLSELKNRFGTIEESLNYLDQKKQQLREYENISFTKTNLQQSLQEQEQTLQKMAEALTKARQKAAKKVQKELNGYLKALRLTPVHFVFSQKPLSADGIDRIDLDLKGSTLKTLSGG
ncbi:MAG: DNA recombination protein RecN, partial [Campylobacterota bacterium]